MSNEKVEYTKKYFTLDGTEISVPGWSYGEKWNGWGCPLFEESAVLEAIDKGGFISSPTFKLIKHDDGVIAVSNDQGYVFPEDFDFSEIIELVKKETYVDEFDIGNNVTLQAYFYPKHTINIEGDDVSVYAVGTHYWCWEESDKPVDNYTKKYFTLDGSETSIPGWSSGRDWNGWGCPSFEKEAILEALENGGLIQDDYFKIILLDDSIVSIQSQSGPFPEDYDFSKVIKLLKNDEEVYNYKIASGVHIDAQLFDKHTISVGGNDIKVYALGSDEWVWEESDEPIQAETLKI